MWVIKIGGSILDQEDSALVQIARTLIDLASSERLLIVTGGGRCANIIRSLDKREDIHDEPSHLLAIVCMHLNAYRLHSLFPKAFIITSDAYTDSKRIPILLPMDTVNSSDLPKSWDITSDTISAYIAKILNAKLILVKDVDGLIKPYPGGKLITEIGVDELFTFQSTPLDSYIPVFLRDNQMGAYLVNGHHPERLEMVIRNQNYIGTHILPCKR